MTTELNDKFGIKNILTFIKEPSGFLYACVANEYATAKISLYGAQILSFHPRNADDLLWVSKKSLYETGKAIRGGIPLCCPWFGSYPTDKTKPSHGFARLSNWQVTHSRNRHDGTTEISFELTSSKETNKYWNNDFIFSLNIAINKKLTISLNIQNLGEETIDITAALHSYFNISDINKIEIAGLENSPFIDSLTAQKEIEKYPIKIDKEVDRIYFDHSGECFIRDPELKRTIKISKQGSNSTVVWNPWIDKAERMSDFGNDEYKNMICVETTNADTDARQIEPGSSHTISTTISLD